MTVGRHTAEPESAVERWLIRITTPSVRTRRDGTAYAPGRSATPRPPRETSDLIAGVYRQLRAIEQRTWDDPQNIAQLLGLAGRIEEAVNIALYVNSVRNARDPRTGASYTETAVLLGMTRQGARKRGLLGREALRQRDIAAGAIPFAEAKRERAAIQAAAEYAAVNLADWVARKRAA